MATASAPGIGTLRERPLHASLKRWYAEPGDRTEVAVDGYVIDLVRGDLLIEVQTRGLSSARHKVAALLGRGHRLRVISPIAVDTWIVKFDADGGVLSRRRSPRHGIASDVFAELVSIATLLADPGLEIDLVLIEMEERRFHAPGRPVAPQGLDRRGASTRRGPGHAPASRGGRPRRVPPGRAARAIYDGRPGIAPRAPSARRAADGVLPPQRRRDPCRRQAWPRRRVLRRDQTQKRHVCQDNDLADDVGCAHSGGAAGATRRDGSRADIHGHA